MSIISIRKSDIPNIPEKVGDWELSEWTSTNSSSPVGSLYLTYERYSGDELYQIQIRIADHDHDGNAPESDTAFFVSDETNGGQVEAERDDIPSEIEIFLS